MDTFYIYFMQILLIPGYEIFAVIFASFGLYGQSFSVSAVNCAAFEGNSHLRVLVRVLGRQNLHFGQNLDLCRFRSSVVTVVLLHDAGLR
jgi:hypothetical protein